MDGDDGLVGFLRARLDEDEAIALGAAEGDGRYAGRQHWSARGGMITDAEDPDWAVADLSPCVEDDRVAAHMALHDPARVLREAEALRMIVADCARALGYPANVPLANLARRTLGRMAAFWSDHPDYRPEWRP